MVEYSNATDPMPHLEELSSERSRQLIGEIRTFPNPPGLIFCGRDPFQRPDLMDLIRYATRHGVLIGMRIKASPLATPQALAEAHSRGLARLGIALDGATAEIHNAAQEDAGSYERTLELIRCAAQMKIPVQVNTTLSLDNVHELDDLAQLLAKLGIDTWAVHFLVPDSEDLASRRIPADQMEQVFEQLWKHAQQQPYMIKTGQAPHYRRFVHRAVELELNEMPNWQRTLVRYGCQAGINDGNGLLYVTHTGQICPSPHMPIVCGRFPFDSVVKTYQQHELFKALRDEDRLGGKCGRCLYRFLCGGSRARAYALTGNPLAAEPDCSGHFPETPLDAGF